MAKTATVTLRIEPDLLTSLKARARHLERSVSAEVVRLIARELGEPTEPPRIQPVMGMFRHFEAPALAEFDRVRTHNARRMLQSILKDDLT